MKLKTVIFLIVFYINVNAQLISDYGIRLGVGVSNQSWNYKTDFDLDFDNKLGISPRLFANLFNMSFFQLQAEIGYMHKGFEDKVPLTTTKQPFGTGKYITLNNRLSYLSISTLAKFRYENKLFTPYLIIGPQLNIILSKNIEKGWRIVFDKFKENNIDISIGFGSEIDNLLPFLIFVEYRYERDLIDNYDSDNINIKNHSHVVFLGIQL